jgi:hypothetical protein
MGVKHMLNSKFQQLKLNEFSSSYLRSMLKVFFGYGWNETFLKKLDKYLMQKTWSYVIEI